MSTTTLVYRSLPGARSAFAHEDDAVARKLSRDAHSIYAEPPKEQMLMEDGHNDSILLLGYNLLLQGAVAGIICSTSLISIVDAADWHKKFDFVCAAGFMACWASFLACREALETLTYRQHYSRERRREKWGALLVVHVEIAAAIVCSCTNRT